MTSLVEKLQISSLILKNTIQKMNQEETSELLLSAADHIMDLENEVARLQSIIDGIWPGTPEADLNELCEHVTKTAPEGYISEGEFDLLFSRLDYRILFSQLAKRMRNVTMHGGKSYSVCDIEDLRAVLEQHLYEKLTGKE
jgi:hypothetical protein